ncbi:MAG: hypothetical protein QOH71_462 [Blastocatellia bacterium]|jgi:uncharacterized protein YjbI with pentapeptide repeats|nr:hypothetical protein [Blastocatellia bacterium]
MSTISRDNLLEKIALHKEWLRTVGRSGQQLRLEKVDLAGVNLSDESVMEGFLPEVRFDEAILRGCDFGRANLTSASFVAADLTGADFTKANCDNADFRRSCLRGARGFRASFARADFRDADLSDINLFKAFLQEARFDNAVMERANLERAFLNGASLAGAHLRGAQGVASVVAPAIYAGVGEDSKLEGKAALEWLVRAATEPADQG